jgi:selenide, water dikinase
LERLLKKAKLTIKAEGTVLAGPWENSSVVKVNEDIALLNTLDFFTPIVDEPELQGRIAACNLTSDIYTMGVSRIASVLCIMAFPLKMPKRIAVGMLKGFSDFCREMDVPVVGGHTIMNPWPILGGAATGVSTPKDIVYSRGAKPGDILVLTKPLGIQPAMAAYRLRKDVKGRSLLKEIPNDVIDQAISGAIKVMTTSNKPVAEVMQEVKVNAATDITGFGLKGHTENMAKLSHVDVRIERLAVISGTPSLNELLGYSLLTGEASETAGGVLLSVDKKNLDALRDGLDRRGVKHFRIGTVIHGSGKVQIAKQQEIIEV